VRFGDSANYLRAWYGAGFVQDDWRATSKFTLLAGVRYEYFEPFTEKYGHLSDLELGPDFSSATVVTGLNPDGLPSSLLRGEDTHFTPRVGIAYRPWTKSHFVIRAGYGMFYDESIYQRLVTGNLVSEPPFAQSSTLVTSPAQTLTLQNGFPAVSPNVLTNSYAVDPGYHTPYAQTWNFTLQDEIFRNVILDVGYLGTVGRHLDLLLGPNPAGSNNTPNALEYTYETAGAESNYNALQVSLRRQFHRGLSIWGRYTYSKALDDASSIGGLAGTSSAVAQNYLDPAADYGLSSFDRRHQFLLNYNYELPFGDRKRFLNHGGPLEHVFGNWQVSGVTTIETGTPSTAYVQGNVSSSGRTGAYYSLRGNATGEPVSLPGSERTTLEYFNTAAFTLPITGELGNAGVDTIPGPPMYNFNVSLDRQIMFNREKGINGDFRVAANNVFNTPNFTGLGTVVNSVNFGRVTSVSTMRAITFSFRLRF
jgi:trimeric autotransporter adhesin